MRSRPSEPEADAAPGCRSGVAWPSGFDGAPSTDSGSVRVRAALEEHYAHSGEERSGLAELAIAAAELDGHPAADHPDLVARAVDDLGDDAFIEDVLAWVRGALAGATDAVRT